MSNNIENFKKPQPFTLFPETEKFPLHNELSPQQNNFQGGTVPFTVPQENQQNTLQYNQTKEPLLINNQKNIAIIPKNLPYLYSEDPLQDLTTSSNIIMEQEFNYLGIFTCDYSNKYQIYTKNKEGKSVYTFQVRQERGNNCYSELFHSFFHLELVKSNNQITYDLATLIQYYCTPMCCDYFK